MSEHNKKRQRLQDADKELFLKVVLSLRMIYDPEIPVNVYDLGLIYDLELDENETVHVRMTLTAPNCPEAERIPTEIYHAVMMTDGVKDAEIELTFDPPWGRDRMSNAALLTLGLI